MKNYGNSTLILSTILIFIFTLATTSINAQHGHNHKGHHHKGHHHAHKKQHVRKVNANHIRKSNRQHAVKVIRRTNKVIMHAHRLVQKNKIYTGHLSKSVHHQRFAKRLLKKNKPHKSMQHSRLARFYASKAIKANKGIVSKEYMFNDEEAKIAGTTIQNKDLENEYNKSNPNIIYDDAKITKKEMSDLEVLETDPSDYVTE